MKRDVQVGVILGVIILAIIGVFLSTRTTVKEPNILIPEIEEDTQVSELKINELPQDPPASTQESFKETTTAIQNTEQKGSAVENMAKIEEKSTENEDNVIEGEWNKAKEAESIRAAANTEKEPEISDQEDWKDIHSSDIKKSGEKLQIHKVQYNEDLHKIAKKYYGDVSKWLLILNANKDKIQDRNSLKIGTELIIPKGKIASQKEITETTTPSLSQVIEVEDTKSTSKKHIIQPGDSLYKIAVKYYNDGAKWNKILEANKKIIKNQNSLKTGQEITIPDL